LSSPTTRTDIIIIVYFQLQAEIKIHRTLKHTNVCEYKHFFEDRQNCYILLELCHNHSMNEMIKRRKRLTEPETAFLMRQIVEATKYLHEQLVIHRDLKLGNLFLDRNMNIKVGDLGLATQLESADEKRKTICGTPNYIAPEVIQGDRATRGHSFEVDIWSMGVIMFTCLVGKPPYEAKDVKATYQRIINNEYSFPKNLSICEDAKDLIVSMLQSKPLDRPTLQEISCHPFLTTGYIPESLPSNATHVAPQWAAKNGGSITTSSNNNSALAYSGRPDLPKSNSQSVRRPFGARDANIDNQRVEKKAPIKAVVKGSVSTASTVTTAASSPPIMDVQGAVKNAWSVVVNATTATPTQSSSKFQVFDETSNNKQPSSDIVSRTANMGLRSQQDALPYAVTRPSPRNIATPNMDTYILNNMVERVSIVLDIVASRDYSSVPADSPSLVPIIKAGPVKWVERYVDYTSKYGLGYLLSDGR
jgi:serine/threonine protein kinase